MASSGSRVRAATAANNPRVHLWRQKSGADVEDQSLQIKDRKKAEGAAESAAASAAEPPRVFVHTRHSRDSGWGLSLTFSPVPPVLRAPITQQTY